MNRDSEKFIELLTTSQGSVFGYIMSLCHDHAVARDILQEANISIWRKASDFEEGTNFNAWACRIAYFHVLSHRRKKAKEKIVFDDDVFDYLAERQEQRSEMDTTRISLLQVCLGQLPEHQQQLIHRRYHEGVSVQQIAATDQKSEGAVSQTFFRVRASLQKCLQRQLRNLEGA